MIIVISSCNRSKRIFFQSINSENYFLDTFSLMNLKGFGISKMPTGKNKEEYYDFNSSTNSIYMQGYFNKVGNKIFFLPENTEKKLLFFDKSFWDPSIKKVSQKIITKSQSMYEITPLGIVYNHIVKDSSFKIEMRMSNILNRDESLIFDVNKNFDVLSILFINCKNDTLMMEFLPKQEVYFKHVNKSAVCL
ncbi:MAG: hypothetical protein ABI237_18535 [Ginsengibacter sp.]